MSYLLTCIIRGHFRNAHVFLGEGEVEGAIYCERYLEILLTNRMGYIERRKDGHFRELKLELVLDSAFGIVHPGLFVKN